MANEDMKRYSDSWVGKIFEMIIIIVGKDVGKWSFI